MSNEIEVDLGQEGIKYLEEMLSQGRYLAKILPEMIDVKSGKVVTRLSAIFRDMDATDYDVYDFEDGILPELTRETDMYGDVKIRPSQLDITQWVYDEIEGYIRGDDRRCCVIEYEGAMASDPFLESHKAPAPLLIHQEDVYSLLTGRSYDGQLIVRALNHASSDYPPLIGVLSSSYKQVPDLVLPPKRKEIGSDYLEEIVRGVERIFVAAYDGEGYVMWSPGSVK